MPDSSAIFRCIGKGGCGSVWSPDREGISCAIKREDGDPTRSLRNDYDMHRLLLESLSRFSDTTTTLPPIIPACHALIEPSDIDWWATRLHRFPETHLPCRVLISERIPPFPQAVRNLLVDRYCPPALVNSVKSSRGDQDCLVRAYLGRKKRPGADANVQRFSLRDLPLHVDQMDQLNLDTLSYAKTMADALAIMHWGAKVDADNVEFVLAPPRDPAASTSSFCSAFLGKHEIWLLDFDCCKPMTMDAAGCTQACEAYFRNDPYYPRPHRETLAHQHLWNAFRTQFVLTSHEILGESSPHKFLPTLLMDMIEEEEAQRIQRY